MDSSSVFSLCSNTHETFFQSTTESSSVYDTTSIDMNVKLMAKLYNRGSLFIKVGGISAVEMTLAHGGKPFNIENTHS